MQPLHPKVRDSGRGMRFMVSGMPAWAIPRSCSVQSWGLKYVRFLLVDRVFDVIWESLQALKKPFFRLLYYICIYIYIHTCNVYKHLHMYMYVYADMDIYVYVITILPSLGRRTPELPHNEALASGTGAEPPEDGGPEHWVWGDLAVFWFACRTLTCWASIPKELFECRK